MSLAARIGVFGLMLAAFVAGLAWLWNLVLVENTGVEAPWLAGAAPFITAACVAATLIAAMALFARGPQGGE